MKAMNINDSYMLILNPFELVKYFKSDEEFMSWCETGTILDLTETLKVFEGHEMYEHCQLIKNVIDEKIDNINLSSAL